MYKKTIIKNKNTISQKDIIKIMLYDTYGDCELTTIGNVDEIDSEIKNDVFDEIIGDKYGNIIDLRIFSKKPSPDETAQMVEYWIELEDKFSRKVRPYICITGD